ncbi:cAMP-binding domain of CRP or a regulatory subunit of cAMP-dependent protein kinases [Arachidicoccus rhizosphaerae]|jgi:DNA-binding response OmpR family regulator|uniref:cAMP-binding domain of CRP or a regulatory subunit of cAMP-dependent protein kinases n=1 Tax=Arachidicoccus rhizosphaerae TaxID=551991 RepID=A0A1H3VI19_9BACT|nr:response regulator [Arachidicoccus rhizosphaerae]SDZ74415.1 cAMP-binding domain of CRP or a regulatory subunit of cAMP-dependent protein kinases [Arachidicoccus rhizosphaerae]
MKKILLIEDNQELLENTAEILSLGGYEVMTALDGKSGVEKAILYLPDLIISDIMMPGLDGYGVLLMVQKHAELKDVPFIFMTAKTERSDFRKGMEMGADDYITKPFNEAELLNAIETRLKKSARNTIKEKIAEIPNEPRRISLETLLEGKITNQYKKRQVIFSEGNHPHYLFYVAKGKVKAYKTSEDGKELIVGLYGAGDFLGYTALLEESTYKVTAEVIEDAVIDIISKKDFFELIQANPDFARRFFHLLADNNNQKAEHMVELAYESLRKRVARVLLLLKAKYENHNTEHFSIHIRREELASLAGTSTESLIRTLSDFKNEGLLLIEHGLIEIINEQKLANMLN